mgnify:CR=1 FL=1
MDAIFISYATNLILPRVGEVSRCGVLAKYDDVSFSKSLGTVVTERLVDTLCILLITGLTLSGSDACVSPFSFQETGTKIPFADASVDIALVLCLPVLCYRRAGAYVLSDADAFFF